MVGTHQPLQAAASCSCIMRERDGERIFVTCLSVSRALLCLSVFVLACVLACVRPSACARAYTCFLMKTAKACRPSFRPPVFQIQSTEYKLHCKNACRLLHLMT